MDTETEDAPAEALEMKTTGDAEDGAEAPREEEGPSPEVLAEAAAAERAARERKAAPTEEQGASESAAEAGDPEADAPASEPESGAASEAPEQAAPEEEAEAAADEPGPGAKLSDEELRREVCALLFASPEALSEGRLVQLTQGAPRARIRTALTELEADLAASPLPLEVRKLAGGWRLMTAAEVSEVIARLFQARKSERLSAAGLETLSVVAYRQPVTKAEIEAIRGVQCGPMLRTLVDRGLVKVTGRAEQPGSPLQYGTTKEFLDRFGLGGLDELPRDGELLG